MTVTGAIQQLGPKSVEAVHASWTPSCAGGNVLTERSAPGGTSVCLNGPSDEAQTLRLARSSIVWFQGGVGHPTSL